MTDRFPTARPLGLVLAFALPILAAAACGAADDGGSAAAQAPAPGAGTASGELALERVADGLEHPWAIAFLPEGGMLVTERAGALRLIGDDGALRPEAVSGTPDVLAERQGGLLDVALHPNFEANRLVYLSYSDGTLDENATSLWRGRLSEDGTALTEGERIWRSDPRGTTLHFGSRIGFLPDGTLLLTLGDAFVQMDEAQNPANTHGTIVRLTEDGAPAPGNPFAEGGNPAVYSYGHRNVQGLAVMPDGAVYAHEHGPKGGDELNRIEAGTNYGWPAITYGVNYNGSIITEETEAPGMAQPLTYWVPSIAPSGMTRVEGGPWEAWQGDLLIGAMNGPRGQKLVRVDLDAEGNVAGREDLLEDKGFGYRAVAQAPDGRIFLATVNTGLDDGAILELVQR